ncbi:DUF3187 domain-containing protein [Candidatus Sulfurimonas marisnigri]|uniref:DUF3187 domain-containing protein n=1 Tax=Candidatus Sulfurimonas marisnigri TaxID=2740405 RepID=A0A7S7M031_9BACT|nr:DUF3187 domain-containing protein [Candidatus Sulfurimonas marisnigri]QOY54425.1 DUF3187 domain-containing protein [Candidatus Sulfurimonas marisnigri]
MYKKIITLLAITSLSLSAYSDKDLDGVDDSLDQCPNTYFSELVDMNGCTIENLSGEHHFDIIYGLNFTKADYTTTEKTDTTTQDLQLDYYYRNFSLQIISSYYNYNNKTYDKSGMNDLFIAAYYKLSPTNELTLRFGAGVTIPTYDSLLNNNNSDYTASMNIGYKLESINLFAGYSYTIINDDDVAGVASYQNTNSFTAGAGFYPQKNLYVSGSYNNSDSIYTNVDTIRTISLYTFYNIDANWFASFSYSYGVSDSASDSSTSFRVGYYF